MSFFREVVRRPWPDWVQWPLVGAAILSIAGCSGIEPPPRADIDRAMRLVADAWITAHPDPGDAAWNFGVHYWGLSALYAETGDRPYFDRLHFWGETNSWQPYGSMLTNNADNTLCGMAYWNQLEAGDSAATISNVEPSIRSQRGASYTWIDLFFMGFPLSARYGQATGDNSFFDGIYRIFSTDRDLLYSTTERLWWRDINWAGSEIFWGRGNGWVLAGLAAMLEYLPRGDTRRDDFVAVAIAMSERVRAIQKPNGFWSSALLPADGYDSSGPETSSTALFTFAVAKLIRLGVLDRAAYLPLTNAAWNNLVRIAVQPDGVLGYCQPGDNQPALRSLGERETADFCVGAFLLAGAELVKLR